MSARGIQLSAEEYKRLNETVARLLSQICQQEIAIAQKRLVLAALLQRIGYCPDTPPTARGVRVVSTGQTTDQELPTTDLSGLLAAGALQPGSRVWLPPALGVPASIGVSPLPASGAAPIQLSELSPISDLRSPISE